MSTVSLPSYAAPLLNRPPSYAGGRHDHQHRLPLADRLGPQFLGTFVKHSRAENAFLRLSTQEDGVTMPVYGSDALVEGTVELTKVDGVRSVEVKVSNWYR
jgi:hypothetical protein